MAASPNMLSGDYHIWYRAGNTPIKRETLRYNCAHAHNSLHEKRTSCHTPLHPLHIHILPPSLLPPHTPSLFLPHPLPSPYLHIPPPSPLTPHSLTHFTVVIAAHLIQPVLTLICVYSHLTFCEGWRMIGGGMVEKRGVKRRRRGRSEGEEEEREE